MMIPSTSTRPDHQFDLQPCKYYRTLRWPWPLFGLLYGPIDVSSEAKRLIAGKLLKSDPEQLEHNTRKIRKICFDDLKHVSHSGCLPKGSLLHGILAISAQNLSLDAGELESLNSMIKTATSTYTNMSLELLSSRVNARKTLTLAACGSRTFKDLKSIAASLANVSPLYQGCEKEIMNDALRWSPPSPVNDMMSYDPAVIDPSSKLSASERWAVKYNSELMRALCDLEKADSTLALGFSIVHPTYSSTYLVCEFSGRTCQAVLLEPKCCKIKNDNNINRGEQVDLTTNTALLLPSRLTFISSVRAIACVFEDLEKHINKNNQKTVDLQVTKLRLHTQGEGCLEITHKFYYMIVEQHQLVKMRRRKEYTRKPQPSDNDYNDDHDTDGDEAENADNSNDDDDDDDAEVEAEPNEDDEDAEIHLVEEELYGDCPDTTCADMDAEWMLDPQNQDLLDLQGIHEKFVAAASERRHTGQGHSASNDDKGRGGDDDHDDVELSDLRPFEDELGEEVLRHMLEHTDVDDHVDSANDDADTFKHVDIDLPTEHIDRCLGAWAKRLDQSMEACQMMASQLRQFESDRLDTCLGHSVSLLIHGGEDTSEVCFVTWVKPYKNLEGRVVNLDESNALIFPSNFLPRVKFTGCIMICQSTGKRIRKRERDVMGDSLLRLQTMFQVGLESSSWALGTGGNLFFSDEPTSCAACGQDMTVSPLRRCSCCLLYWHDSCSKTAGSHVSGFLVTEEVRSLSQRDLYPADLPFTLLSFSQSQVFLNHPTHCRRSIYISFNIF